MHGISVIMNWMGMLVWSWYVKWMIWLVIKVAWYWYEIWFYIHGLRIMSWYGFTGNMKEVIKGWYVIYLCMINLSWLI